MNKILISVKNRVNRILKKTVKGYLAYDVNIDNKIISKDFNLVEGDQIIGLYENDNKKDTIIISNNGLYLFNCDVQFVPYVEIVDIKYHIQEQKSNTKYLIIKLLNQEINLLLDADKGRFSDVFEFSRFLNRVISDIKQ